MHARALQRQLTAPWCFRVWVAEDVRVQLVVLARKREQRVVPSAKTAGAVRALSHALSPLSSADAGDGESGDGDGDRSLGVGLQPGGRQTPRHTRQPHVMAHAAQPDDGAAFR